METAEQIAARYGAVVAPGVEVQHIEQGKNSFFYPVWCEKRQGLFFDETNDERIARTKVAIWGKNSSQKPKKKRSDAAKKSGSESGKKTTAEALIVRKKVAELHAQGKSTDAIASAVKMHHQTVRGHLRALGLKANCVRQAAYQDPKIVAQVSSLIGGGMSQTEAARQIGIGMHAIARLCKEHGICRPNLRAAK
jgi:DNA invertase Pin-like site-specific DNA recombinase